MAPRRRKKQGLSRFLTSPKLFTFLGVVVFVLISIPMYEKWQKKQEVDKEVRQLKQEISEVESDNKRLDELIQYLQSDQFLEEQARKNLGLKKKGEEVAVIEEKEGKVAGAFAKNQEDRSTSSDKDQKKSRELGNAGKWWNYFFGSKNSSSTGSDS